MGQLVLINELQGKVSLIVKCKGAKCTLPRSRDKFIRNLFFCSICAVKLYCSLVNSF